MKFSYFGIYIGALLFALPSTSLHAFEPTINLAGRRDLVLSVENRQTVLEVGSAFLAPRGRETLALIDGLKDPFSFQARKQLAPFAPDQEEAEEATPERIQYEDAEVLRLSAASFAKRVRGSIIRGDTTFLQLEGGVLLRPGTSFPVRLPEAADQSFTLTISEITPQGYTLQLGEATKQVKFNNRSQSHSIRFTQP